MSTIVLAELAVSLIAFQLSRALYLVSLRGSGYVSVGYRGCHSSGHCRNVTLRCPLLLASRLRLGGYGLTLASGFRWSVSVSSRFLSRRFVWLIASLYALYEHSASWIMETVGNTRVYRRVTLGVLGHSWRIGGTYQGGTRTCQAGRGAWSGERDVRTCQGGAYAT